MMRNRQMMALLLGVAPIVALGQIATAQPANQAAMNPQGVDHSTMNHAAMNHATPPANASDAAAEATNAVDATPNATAEPMANSGDDLPPK